MGLKKHDAQPFGIDLKTSYSNIKYWYQTNIDLAPYGEYGANSRDLISRLKSPTDLSSEEIKMILWEVVAGLLEWGYHGSDGHYKMGAYAHVAIQCSIGAGHARNLDIH
jgi:hypothetical protein